ncbi:hypothetical protein OOZ19_19230 [Saccharopolyspora sp. NFXS83]|uniref:hypothetical protein n=1 Tax=Saccharopolyspora sp. NFXS83 TaxID=2993560 RepID=UPI00224AFE9E|nr:hypothetical protein [Saccharopolyspora sp. NFXS83]MCX2732377.1 hypothetical protein [Saccharopolyspora sp. NFXS83]
MQANAIRAASSAYRYVGMGNDHVTRFAKTNPVGPFHFYDMSGQAHDKFVAATEELEDKARG